MKSSNFSFKLSSFIKILFFFIHPVRIPNIYDKEYHLNSNENKLNATGSKLLMNIFNYNNRVKIY